MNTKEAIAVALKEDLRWITERIRLTLHERAKFDALNREMPDRILAALHDAGYSVVPIDGSVEASLTVSSEAPYTVELRATVKSEGHAWASHRIAGPQLLDPEFKEHAIRATARVLSRHLEEDILEQLVRLSRDIDLREVTKEYED